tara:strand:+ start:5483 stop:5656 length:174 start_codon:yes stop_codon:yes gene_type:complete
MGGKFPHAGTSQRLQTQAEEVEQRKKAVLAAGDDDALLEAAKKYGWETYRMRKRIKQ